MNIDEIWKKYAKTKDRKLKQMLIEEYVGLVKIIAGRMYNYYGSKIEYDDLIGFGIIGLIDSIDKFDINKNIKFETYAQIRIKGSIIDNIRKLDWVPRSLRKKSKEIQEGLKILENKLGRMPSNEELAKYLKLPIKEVEYTLADTVNFNITSLEELILSQSEYYINSYREKTTPENMLEKKEMKRILGDIIDELPEKQKLVVSLYYYEELTYKEIGTIMKLSESRISQIHSKAIYNIRNKLEKIGVSGY